MLIQNTVQLLGLTGEDKVTGYKGAITSVSFDLYGCIQLALTPPAKEGEAELKNGHWFDSNRIKVSNTRVMPVPEFEAYGDEPSEYRQGAAEKGPPKL